MNECLGSTGGIMLENWWNDQDRGKPKCSEKTPFPVPLRPPQTLQTGLGSNLGLRDERPATNRLSHSRPYQSPASG